MSYRVRVLIRWIVILVCIGIIVRFQQTTSMKNLLWMLGGLAGLLGVMYDYNAYSNRPTNYVDQIGK